MSQKKLTPQTGQQGLKNYLHTVSRSTIGQPLSSSTPKNENSTTKKRTPPSIEKPVKKRTYSTSSSGEEIAIVSVTMEPEEIENVNNSQIENGNDVEERRKKVFSQFTPEIIEYLREVIKEVQKPLEDKLNTLINIQNKQLEQDENIKELRREHKHLKRKCEKMEIENDNLKSRVSSLESKLLESNLIMHGIPEEPWEQETNRHEKIYNAIASTVEEVDPWKKLQTARKITIRSSK